MVTIVAPAILVVEHDLALRETLEQVLHRAGFAPVSAPSGAEGLNLLRCGVPAKVILLDLQMPIADGWEFRCEQRRDPKLAHIPVIVTSASNARLPPGLVPDAVLRKPIDLDRLIACVRALCESAVA